MKLKKIASLALAGIMAVSMLAGCKDGSSSSTPTEPDVNPVDSSLANYVNSELDAKYTNILKLSADSTLDSALSKAAAMIDENELKATSTNWITQGSAIQNSFIEMVKADTCDFNDFKDTTKDTVVADLIIVPGNFTEDGMKDQVVTMMKGIINTNNMPTDGTSGGKTYNYTYNGNIAVVKVESNSGEYSAYVVGLVVDQTVKEVVTGV
ncbi:hypothetical protein B5G12_14190 [Faecalibacterium sp. An58]|uniref:hypothetical protein n=1 Tax=Faecalibacterium sp. An58 TaxID=1965648 RepID=UPI000B3A4CD3|nr:hypothetical protein [Faecalibacterium sp. An58]OUN66645.1 hypothetical protein B5G12_14190 [Faecalibacterium sp. An58]